MWTRASECGRGCVSVWVRVRECECGRGCGCWRVSVVEGV